MLCMLHDLVWFKLPEDHFLKQSFYVNIMVDTSDGNYDYTLNSAGEAAGMSGVPEAVHAHPAFLAVACGF